MIVEKGIDEISCSGTNFGVVAGYIAENISKEGGKWYEDLYKLLTQVKRNRQYLYPSFVICWRINLEEQCQKEFQRKVFSEMKENNLFIDSLSETNESIMEEELLFGDRKMKIKFK